MKRPISPHLSIYKPQITSVFSILHRITGVYMFVFFLLLALVCFIFSQTDASLNYSAVQDNFILRNILIISVIIFIVCLSYHVCTGIRYLFWSCGIGVDIINAKQSATVIIITTIVMSLTSVCMFLN